MPTAPVRRAEFDYVGTQACIALREDEVVPATPIQQTIKDADTRRRQTSAAGAIHSLGAFWPE